MRIALLSGAFPPTIDGIGDYTWWLSQALAKGGHAVTVYTARGVVTQNVAGVEVISFFAAKESFSLSPLPSLLADRGFDWLIVQYNPFGFGKRGFCPGLPRVLEQIRKGSEMPRIAVMFHETFVEAVGWKFRTMRLWQKPICRRLYHLADYSFISIEAWRKNLDSGRSKNGPISHLPIGSNLPDPIHPRESAREALGISKETLLLGTFGTLHVSRRFDWMAQAIRSLKDLGRPIEFVHIGKGSEAVRTQFKGLSFRSTGFVDPDVASKWMSALDLYLSPFTDGLSCRRGSAIAALQHDIPVLSNRGERTDPMLLEGLPGIHLSDDNSDTFAELLRDLVLAPPVGAARNTFLEYFSWEVIAQRMIRELNNQPSSVTSKA